MYLKDIHQNVNRDYVQRVKFKNYFLISQFNIFQIFYNEHELLMQLEKQ